MKKLICAVVLCLPLATFAQQPVGTTTTDNRPLRMGLYVEPNLGFMASNGDRIEPNGSRFSLNYGLNVDISLSANDNYAFSTGIAIVNTGGEISFSDASVVESPIAGTPVRTENSALYRLRYLQIPLTMKLRTNELGYARYFAQVGFDLGFNIFANRDRDEEVPGRTLRSYNEEDISAQAQLLRFSFRVGAGVEYNLHGNTSLFASLNWNNGLMNVFSRDARIIQIRNGEPVYELQENGELALDANGEVIKTTRMDAKLNYFSLTVGVLF